MAIIVKKHDFIDNTDEIIYKGDATFIHNTLSFGKDNDIYNIEKISKNLVLFKHDGQMSYQLDIKRNAKQDTILTVDQYDIEVTCLGKQLYFSNEKWIIGYQLYQYDSLLFDSEITIEFLIN